MSPFLAYTCLSWIFPDSSVGKESACNAGDASLIPGLGRPLWRRVRLPTAVFLGFPIGSDGKESTCNAGDLGSIPGFGRCPGEGRGNPLQYSFLEKPHGQRSLVGYSPWGHKESDMTERQAHAHVPKNATFPHCTSLKNVSF